MKANLKPYNTADYLKTADDIAGFLEALIEEDPALVPAALGDIARAQGMTEVARRAGLSRENLYRSLSESGNPSADTLFKVLAALGIKLHPTIEAPAKQSASKTKATTPEAVPA